MEKKNIIPVIPPKIGVNNADVSQVNFCNIYVPNNIVKIEIKPKIILNFPINIL